MNKPVTIRMAPWVITAVCAAAVAFLALSSYFYFYGDSYLLRYAGMALAALVMTAAADAIASRIVLDGDTMHVNSLMRRRVFPRSDFVAAQVSGGTVVLKRQAGGWLILPGTGRDAVSVRDTLDAWLKQA
jgi:hypothetical protein